MTCKRPDCKKPFKPTTSWQNYCTKDCANVERVRKHRRLKKEEAKA